MQLASYFMQHVCREWAKLYVLGSETLSVCGDLWDRGLSQSGLGSSIRAAHLASGMQTCVGRMSRLSSVGIKNNGEREAGSPHPLAPLVKSETSGVLAVL